MSSVETLIIILHYGSVEDTLECIASLERSVRSSFDIIVINTDAHGEPESILAENYPTVGYRDAGPATGFAAGNNIGLQFSLERGYRFSLLLNNDTVAEEDFLQPMVDLLTREPAIAMAGPAIYHHSDTQQLWSCGGWVNRWSGSMAGNRSLDNFRGDYADVDYLPGACVLVRNEVLSGRGLMSEEYLLGVEEADWAIQAQRHGFRVVACPRARVLHKVGMSSRRTPEFVYNSFRNRFVFLRRQFGFPMHPILAASLLVEKMFASDRTRVLCLRAFTDHWKYRTIRRGHLDAVRDEFS